MRTTISIEDSLLELAKQASLDRSCSLGEVIEDALRESLAVKKKTSKVQEMRPLKTYRGTGLRPGVDLDSNASLLEAMEGR